MDNRPQDLETVEGITLPREEQCFAQSVGVRGGNVRMLHLMIAHEYLFSLHFILVLVSYFVDSSFRIVNSESANRHAAVCRWSK